MQIRRIPTRNDWPLLGQYDHIETLIGVMGNLQDLTGNNVAALGTKVIPQSDNLNLIESWIEAGMSSPLARGSGQFDQFCGTEETKVQPFVCI